MTNMRRMAYPVAMTTTEITPKSPEFDLADRCMKARDVAGLTQRELSERTGISVRTITRYENRTTTRPSKLVLNQWAMACGVSVEWLRGERSVPGGAEDSGTRQTSHKRESRTLSNRTGSGRNRGGGRAPVQPGFPPHNPEHPGYEIAN